jgi:GT2 family glycosyltransferase
MNNASSANGDVAQAVGVVVIGRNEGERLKRCLRSLLAQGAGPIVYVDSGSTDGSVPFARGLGVDVVELDRSLPFTMARARNVGFDALIAAHSQLHWVQFVDGDCEVCPGWIDAARRVLLERPDVALVCGRRRERFPEASIYNRLADMEWNGPVGEVEESGGDVLFRTRVFASLAGFTPTMIAGEEPELCVRVRLAGFKIVRLAQDMTIHDAALLRFSQWWTRMRRGGHAYAEGMARHGLGPTRHRVRQTLSALGYGLILPLSGCAVGLGWLPAPLGLLLPAAYLKAGWGSYRARRDLGDPPADALVYAGFCLLGKVPEALGVVTYWANRVRGRYAGLMEYKGVPAPQGVTTASPPVNAVRGVA